ncbi:MAG TPA: P1 family peptidase [Thermomicrobiales bacterium]|nr:P1 family peptidase [Thermomicrobiales bacterium]
MTLSEASQTSRPRLRGLGIGLGRMAPGRWNAITDVPGVRIGHVTLVHGEGPLVVGHGPVRTGVTVVIPRGEIEEEPVFAAHHVLNGNGEMTGTAWIAESGLLTTPVALTNTHSVGVVRDALIAYRVARTGNLAAWSLPVVAETWDGFLSDINGMHVKPKHVFAALDAAASGPIAEGNVGGGTGMICHGFKGGIGTSSRALTEEIGGWTVGVLVQANYGQRRLLRIDGVPVGEAIPASMVPTPGPPPQGTGSIIVVVATDAPLLPLQCRRLAQRATLGIGRAGGLGENGSGDLVLAFSTGNRGLSPESGNKPISVNMLPHPAMNPLFEAVVEATEEAIANALCAAVTMRGVDGRVAHALPLDRLQEAMLRAKLNLGEEDGRHCPPR